MLGFLNISPNLCSINEFLFTLSNDILFHSAYPWSYLGKIEEIKQILRGWGFVLTCVLRSANFVSYSLAKEGVRLTQCEIGG